MSKLTKNDLYNLNPTKCGYCNNTVPYERHLVKKFCNLKCSNAFNNTRNGNAKYEIIKCLCCDKDFKAYSKNNRKYCTAKCSSTAVYNNSVKTWLNGESLGYTGKSAQLSTFVRRYMHETFGTACSQCGWDEKHPDDGLPLTEIDHIDGDATNTVIGNLRILCPNCHSKTSTYKSRNRNGRKSRYT